MASQLFAEPFVQAPGGGGGGGGGRGGGGGGDPPVTGNPPVTGGFPSKRPVTRRIFPFDDVIMEPVKSAQLSYGGN